MKKSQGLQDEVARLRAAGYSRDLPALRAVGYRQMWSHLAGETDYPTMVAAAKTASRQYAKRQLTWLRGDPHGHWLNPAGRGVLDRVCALIGNGAG
jgi:tRNA dimethylallyltransferase